MVQDNRDKKQETPGEDHSLRSRLWTIYSFLQGHSISAMGMVFLAAFILSYVGIYKYGSVSNPAQPSRPLDIIYFILQLLFVSFSFDDRLVPWELEVSRFVAPLLLYITALVVILSIFNEKLARFRIRYYRGHNLIIGLGSIGRHLARECLRNKEKVVILEKDELNPEIEEFRLLGAMVFIEDGGNTAIVRQSRTWLTRQIFINTGNDAQNNEIALKVLEIIKENYMGAEKSSGKIQRACYIHLHSIFRKNLYNDIFVRTANLMPVKFYNVYDNAARLLFDKYPPETYAGPSNSDPIHLVVIGFNWAGESVVLHAARVGHYANGKKIRITVLCGESDRSEEFKALYPSISEVCELEFIPKEIESPDLFGGRMLWEMQAKKPITMVIICNKDEIISISCALRLWREMREFAPKIPIMVLVRENMELFQSLINKNETSIRSFGSLEETCSQRYIKNEDLEVLALAIHDNYLQKCRDHGDTVATKPYMLPWDQLPEEIKETNRQQADHLPVKLRAIGHAMQPIGDEKRELHVFSEQEVELLARMEHARWCAGHYLAGWTYAPGSKVNINLKTHPHLVPYDSLPENIKEINRDEAKNIPKLLHMLGYEVIG